MTGEVHNHSEGSPENLIQAESVRDIYLGGASPSSHPRPSASRDAKNDVLDGLARKVLAQWRDEANVRGLWDRVPLTIPWELERSERVGLAELVARVRALGPRQLVITGPAGAGKSSLAVLLVVKLLEGRTPRSGEAVPVLLPLPHWEPGESIQDWVITRISEDYEGLVAGLDEHVARSLVEDRRIVPVLDGFDELDPSAREEAVKAVRRDFGMDGPLLLTSRPEEYQDAVGRASFLRNVPVLHAHPVPPEAGRAYLSRMCHQDRVECWQSVFDAVERNPDGPVGSVLSSPLMLGLAAAVYESKDSDPRELLDEERLPTHAHIRGHLLDGLIPAVCARGPRPSHLPGVAGRWRYEKADTYFRFLAGQIRRNRTQSIGWWQLRSLLTEPGIWGALVIVAVALCGTGVSFLVAALISVLGESPALSGLGILGIVKVLSAVASMAVIASALGRLLTRHLFIGFDERPRRPALGVQGSVLLAVAGAATAAIGVAVPGSTSATVCVFVLPLLSGVLLTRPAESDTGIRARLLLRGERRIALIEAAVVAPVIAVTSLAFFRWLNGEPWLIAGGLVVACSCSATVLVALSRWGRWTATRLRLAYRGHLPWDVLGFLEDARQLGVLRQVGGDYQFRHAELTSRLADDAADNARGRRRRRLAEPREVVLRSSVRSIGTLRSSVFDMAALVAVFILVVSPMSSRGGFPADWHQSWMILLNRWPVVLGMLGVLGLDALALRAVATRLRIGAEAVELNEGRKLRLRWDDVEKVQVRRIRPRKAKGHSPGLSVSYCLAMRPKPGRTVPTFLTDQHGWVRVWDLGPTEVVPPELEEALSRFAGDLWRREG